jgi:hypothetical protein
MITLLNTIEAAAVFGWIRDSAYAYPVLLWLHLIALSMWAGLVMLAGMQRDAEKVTAGHTSAKHASLVLAVLFGALLFGAKASQYAYNPWFWVKILLLILMGVGSLVFRNQGARLVTGVSLLLLAGAVLAARGPATVRDLMHAVVDPSSEFLFDSVQTIVDERGTTEIAPRTEEEWAQVRARADVLLRVPAMLTAEGRRGARPRDRAANPEVELETPELQALLQTKHDDFALRAQKLHEAVSIIKRAIDAKDKDALLNSLNDMDVACEGCHVRYWYPKDSQAVQAAKEAGILE